MTVPPRATLTSLVLLLAVTLTASRGGVLADGHGDAVFSRPVPNWATVDDPYLTCPIGIFANPSTHHWKLHRRAAGTQTALLRTVALPFSQQDTGAIEVSLQDESGIKSISIPYEGDGQRAQDLPLLLDGGKVYDLTLRLTGVGNHYQIGSPNPLLELGWSGPLYSLEPRPSHWALNVDEGESAQVYINTAPPVPAGESSLHLTVTVYDLEAKQILPPARYDPLPAELSIPALPRGGTLVLELDGERSFSLNKTSGSDRGFYAIRCPWEYVGPVSSDAGSVQPPSGGSVDQGTVPREEQQPAAGNGNEGPGVAPFAIGFGSLLGVLAFAAGAWVLVSRRAARERPALSGATAGDGDANSAGGSPEPGRLDAAPRDLLTPREREVLDLLGRGLTNRQISDELTISEGTAKRHVENILGKLDLPSRTQVAAWMARHGLLDGPEDLPPSPPLNG